MEETELIMIRHGETEWNVQRRFQGHMDSPLTDKGIKQTEALGKRFRNEALDQVYSSDLERTRRTAEAMIGEKGYEITFDQRLREKNLGIFEGQTIPEIQAQHPKDFKSFKEGGAYYCIDKGESTLDLLKRARLFLDEIRMKHEGKKIVAVTHGGFVRVVLKYCLGISQDTVTRFMIENTSIHRVLWKNQRWIVAQLGDITHLNNIKSDEGQVS